MNSLFHDLRFGFRMMVRNPIFTLIAVVTLALGIGANTAIFSVVDAVLLRPLPYPQADRLVFLWSTMNSQGVPQAGSALPDYQGWRDQNKIFDGLGAFLFRRLQSLNGERSRRNEFRALTSLRICFRCCRSRLRWDVCLRRKKSSLADIVLCS